MTSYTFQAQVLAEQAHHFTYGDGADPVAGGALATEGLVYAVLSLSEQLHQLVAAQTPATPEPVELVVYRAYHETVPLGMYATREAAQEHCLADAKNNGDDVAEAAWWSQDEDDPEGSEECLVLHDYSGDKGGDLLTDYSVMPLTVATAYDPDAED